MNENINELLENNYLKKEFEIRNLDPTQVFIATPDDLESENRILKSLLEWVQKYFELGSRNKMEKEGYEFPPVGGISPDNDWYIFERWINGLSVRQKFIEQLPKNYILKNPDEIIEKEIICETQKLIETIENSGTSVGLNDDIPARLIYNYLFETLGEENELLIDGGWTIDGCSGYCPDCFQRPWCETGSSSCWEEDEEAGEMFLIDSVKKYVSSSPVSLQILQKLQAEEDEKFENFKEKDNGKNTLINPDFSDDLKNFDFDNDDELPF